MELTFILIAGAVAGLAAGTLNGILTPVFLGSSASPEWRRQRLVTHLASLAVHLLAGIALGFLFWLSWGLTAIVSVRWWQRGLSFAVLTWAAVVLPLITTQALHARITWQLIGKTAWDWLATCVLVGLTCAWVWGNGR